MNLRQVWLTRDRLTRKFKGIVHLNSGGWSNVFWCRADRDSIHHPASATVSTSVAGCGPIRGRCLNDQFELWPAPRSGYWVSQSSNVPRLDGTGSIFYNGDQDSVAATVYWGSNTIYWATRSVDLPLVSTILYIYGASGWCVGKVTSCTGFGASFIRLRESLTSPPAYESCTMEWYVLSFVDSNVIQQDEKNLAVYYATVFDNSRTIPMRGWAVPMTAGSSGGSLSYPPFIRGGTIPASSIPKYLPAAANPYNNIFGASQPYQKPAVWNMFADIDGHFVEVHNIVQGLCWSPADKCFYTENSLPGYKRLYLGARGGYTYGINRTAGMTTQIEVLPGARDIKGNAVPTGVFNADLSHYAGTTDNYLRTVADHADVYLWESVIRLDEVFHPEPVQDLSISAIVTSIWPVDKASIWPTVGVSGYGLNRLMGPGYGYEQGKNFVWTLPGTWLPGEASTRTFLFTAGQTVGKDYPYQDVPEIVTPFHPLESGPISEVQSLTINRPWLIRQLPGMSSIYGAKTSQSLANSMNMVHISGDRIIAVAPIFKRYTLEFLDTIAVRRLANNSQVHGLGSIIEKISDYELRVQWINPGTNLSLGDPFDWYIYKCGFAIPSSRVGPYLSNLDSAPDRHWYAFARHAHWLKPGLYSTNPTTINPPSEITMDCSWMRMASYSLYDKRTSYYMAITPTEKQLKQLHIDVDTIADLPVSCFERSWDKIWINEVLLSSTGVNWASAQLPISRPWSYFRDVWPETTDFRGLAYIYGPRPTPSYLSGKTKLADLPEEAWPVPKNQPTVPVRFQFGTGNLPYAHVRAHAYDIVVVEGKLINTPAGWTWKRGWRLSAGGKDVPIADAQLTVPGLGDGIYSAKLYFIPRPQRVMGVVGTLERPQYIVSRVHDTGTINVNWTGTVSFGGYTVSGNTLSGTYVFGMIGTGTVRTISWGPGTLNILFTSMGTNAMALGVLRCSLVIKNAIGATLATTYFNTHWAIAEDPNRPGIHPGEWTMRSIENTTSLGGTGLMLYNGFTKRAEML